MVRGEHNLEVSISHSERWVALAGCWGYRVGVDIEAVRPDRSMDRMAELVLTDAELATYRGYPEPLRAAFFTSLWTRKEALLKATGEGLRRPMNRIELARKHAQTGTVWNVPDEPFLKAQIIDFPCDVAYSASVAVLGYEGDVAVTMHDIRELIWD